MNKDGVTLQLAVKNIEVYDMVKGKPLHKRLGQSKTGKPKVSTDKKADSNNGVLKIDADDLSF